MMHAKRQRRPVAPKRSCQQISVSTPHLSSVLAAECSLDGHGHLSDTSTGRSHNSGNNGRGASGRQGWLPNDVTRGCAVASKSVLGAG